MKGYFTRLANQSSIAIGVHNRSGQARSGSPSPVSEEMANAPPHVEPVVLVESHPAGTEATSPRRSIERNKRGQAASEGVAPTHADMEMPGETRLAGRQVVASDYPRRFTDHTNRQTAELSATSFIRRDSTSSVEQTSEREAAGSNPGRESGREPGVVRVGELARLSDPQAGLPERDQITDVPGKPHRVEPSIPQDYLEALREWFGSASVSEPAEVQVPSGPKHSVRQLPADVVSGDARPQQEIQEFSLSIGSISIVVEEPAPPAKQQSSSAPPPALPQSGTPPRARDAFALTRNYFRGF